MKKFFSVCIAAAMLTALFCMSVFAADPTHVVGTYSVNGTVADGAESPDGQGSVDVTLSLGETSVNHRYAVDLTFGETALTYESLELTWNVNTHMYEGDNAEAKTVTTAITLENHSDLAVAYAVTTDTTGDAVVNGNLTVASSGAVADEQVDAAKIATVDTPTDPGKADVSVTFTVTPKTTWGAYAQALNGDTAAKKIGSITVTISKAA